MKSKANNELEAQFKKAFGVAVKMREAEEKQNPFNFLVFRNPKGEPIHAFRLCKN